MDARMPSTTENEPKAPFGARAPGRTPIATYLEQIELATVQELLARLRRTEGKRVTMQDALGRALREWCRAQGVTL
jgi:hypothetical protein